MIDANFRAQIHPSIHVIHDQKGNASKLVELV